MVTNKQSWHKTTLMLLAYYWGYWGSFILFLYLRGKFFNRNFFLYKSVSKSSKWIKIFFIKVSQNVDYNTSWEKNVPKTQWLYIFLCPYWYNVCEFIPVGLFIIKKLLKIGIHRNDVWLLFSLRHAG